MYVTLQAWASALSPFITIDPHHFQKAYIVHVSLADTTYEPSPITAAFPDEIGCPARDPVSGIRNGRARVPD